MAGLQGFGAKSEAKILSGIENRAAYAKRHLWWMANERAVPILEGLRRLSGVERAEVAGSLRRLMETVEFQFIETAYFLRFMSGRFQISLAIVQILLFLRNHQSVLFYTLF